MGSLTGVKLPGCKDGHSHPSAAEIKKKWNYASAPSIRLRDIARKKFVFVPL